MQEMLEVEDKSTPLPALQVEKSKWIRFAFESVTENTVVQEMLEPKEKK